MVIYRESSFNLLTLLTNGSFHTQIFPKRTPDFALNY